MKNTIAKVIGGAMAATGTVAVGAIVWKKREREKTLEKERELLTVITEYLTHLEACVSQEELSVKELMDLNSQTPSIEERVNSIGLNVTMDLKKKEMVAAMLQKPSTAVRDVILEFIVTSQEVSHLYEALIKSRSKFHIELELSLVLEEVKNLQDALERLDAHIKCLS